MIIVGWFALPRASRRQVRWLVGVSAAVMVSLPGWLSLASPKGRTQLYQHLATTQKSAALLNVLGEISQISASTRSVVRMNAHILSITQAMNTQENENRVLAHSLGASSRQLSHQVKAVSQLERLTADQVPLTRIIDNTTGTLNHIMAGVRHSAAFQDRRMQGIVTMSQYEETLIQDLNNINQKIRQDLIKSAAITRAMAGR